MNSKLKIGDVVLVYGEKATVRSLKRGSLSRLTRSKKKEDTLVGVEFSDKPVGKCDGTYEGKKLFSCKSQYGLFVLPDTVLIYSEETQAAVKLQKYYRGHYARKLLTELASFKFWNELECMEEKKALSENRDIGSPIIASINKYLDEEKEFLPPDIAINAAPSMHPEPEQLTRRRSSYKLPKVLEDDEQLIRNSMIDPSYTGPTLELPVTREFALALVDFFRDNSDATLPSKYALVLLDEVEDLCRTMHKGAVHEVHIAETPPSRLVLVGDTHGQLNDVLWLFYKFGPPSPTNIYVFNGDIADRGIRACEIFFLLFSFKLCSPSSVIINRGNHESSDMNEVYGFSREVRRKYSGMMFQRFQTVFHLFPLCVIIQKRVMVVHGGLFRKDDVTLKLINGIDRERPCPAALLTYEDTLMFDILWADPRSEPGRGLSTRGPDCISFGPDVTEAFLRKNNLEVCIRSHQVPSNRRGFEPLHDGRCVTLFSASNYCGTTGNYGAVVIFEADMSFEIQEYMAPSFEEMKRLHAEISQAVMKIVLQTRIVELESMTTKRLSTTRTSALSGDILKKLQKMICEHKHELWNLFYSIDTEKTGIIKPSEWRESLAATFGNRLPWCYVMRLLKVTKDGTVDYNVFLNRFKIEYRNAHCKHENWRAECVSQVYESILSADLSLKEMQIILDRNCDGAVSPKNFCDLMQELNIGLSMPQIKILLRLITYSSSSDGKRIDIAEFLGRFKVVYSKDLVCQAASQDWIKRALQLVGKALIADKAEASRRYFEDQAQNFSQPNDMNRRRSSALRAAALFQKFRDYDSLGDGFLSYDDFSNAIKRLPLDDIAEELGFPLTDSRIYSLAEAVDVTGSRKINYFEFLQAFHIVDGASTISVAEEMWSQICTVMYQHSASLRRALHQFDALFTGKVTPGQFQTALESLNDILRSTEAPLTADQIDCLITCMDLDDNCLFDYEEFLESFQPIDTMLTERQPQVRRPNPAAKGGTPMRKPPKGSPIISQRRRTLYQLA